MGQLDLFKPVTVNGISGFVKRSNEWFVLAKAEYVAQVKSYGHAL